jgi:hypothetical protein
MATRDKRTSGTKSGPTTTATTTDAVEQRVLAFAEQIGRIAGTIQAKAEGWMNREALDQQIASVRDGAADLLERLASTTKATKKAPSRAGPRRPVQARGRGPVDAPGRKHRKQLPALHPVRLARPHVRQSCR